MASQPYALYAYDAAGRLEYEIVTKENGGTTNLYQTQYAYSWPASAYVRQVVRTERTYSGGWVDDNRLTYKTDSLGRLESELRENHSGTWSNQYSIAQTYDKNGNRTGYSKSVFGSTSDYGVSENLSYTYNAVNALTAITDAADSRYACAVTCDANNNITQLDESMTGNPLPSPQTNHLYSIFTYDALNRLTLHQTKAWQTTPIADWYFTDRQFEYSGVGAILRSGWKHYKNGTTTSYQQTKQVYDQQTGNFVQALSLGGSPTYGTRWSWAGAQNGGYGQLFGPNADTTNQKAYNLNAAGGAGGPQRRTFINPTTQGDSRELFGQGRPMAKDSVAAWATGTVSAPQNIHMNPVTSHLAFEGTVSSTDYSRVTDAREKGRVGFYGTGFSYAGSSPRVTSETLGRDLNPLGRGDGMAYVGGGQNVGRSAQVMGVIYPSLPLGVAQPGTGNSANNGDAPASAKNCIFKGSGSLLKGDIGDCETDDCAKELCNAGCYSGGVDGNAVYCCKDKLGCVEPISARDPSPGNLSAGSPQAATAAGPGGGGGGGCASCGGGVHSGIGKIADKVAKGLAGTSRPQACADAGYCWDCCGSCGRGCGEGPCPMPIPGGGGSPAQSGIGGLAGKVAGLIQGGPAAPGLQGRAIRGHMLRNVGLLVSYGSAASIGGHMIIQTDVEDNTLPPGEDWMNAGRTFKTCWEEEDFCSEGTAVGRIGSSAGEGGLFYHDVWKNGMEEIGEAAQSMLAVWAAFKTLEYFSQDTKAQRCCKRTFKYMHENHIGTNADRCKVFGFCKKYFTQCGGHTWFDTTMSIAGIPQDDDPSY